MVQDTLDKISGAIPRMPDADMILPYLRRMYAARYYSNFGPWRRNLRPGLPMVLIWRQTA